MYEVLIAAYVSIATYYQVGIIHCFRKIVENDESLRNLLSRCPLSILSACLLILIIAYLWPIVAASRLLFKDWVCNHLHPPIKRCPDHENVILVS